MLVSDTTLSSEYRNFPLLDFLPCSPACYIPSAVYSIVKGRPPPPTAGGRASRAPYSLRKIEAALLLENDVQDVVVPHDDYIEQFIGPDTEVIGVSTMDPFGIGPLTMSFPVLFGIPHYPYVKKEFEALIARINRARKGTKAKLVVAGPGVWEAMVFPEELDRLDIDFAFQGEADDIACTLFREIAEGSSFSSNLFYKGFQTFDRDFHSSQSPRDKFISRRPFSKQFPKVEEIPEIRNPSIKGVAEVMRGCGIGCDFCEVTLRPLRYYPPDKVSREVAVNAKGGSTNAWLQSDEIFAYKHERNFAPSYDGLLELFTAVMGVKGVRRANPTHGRISVPAAYPDLIGKLSGLVGAGPSNFIGIQVGLETGSDRLAKVHMPNKTLPLRIGADGGWRQIVWQGTHNLNLHYWRPAFTVQIGQADERPEDNWETVEMISELARSEVAGSGRPFEFSMTPMQNVPLGVLKSNGFSRLVPDESQLAIYYVAYKHLAREATRNIMAKNGSGHFSQLGSGAAIAVGGLLLYNYIKRVCRKRGLDTDKVDRIELKAANQRAAMSA